MQETNGLKYSSTVISFLGNHKNMWNLSSSVATSVGVRRYTRFKGVMKWNISIIIPLEKGRTRALSSEYKLTKLIWF